MSDHVDKLYVTAQDAAKRFHWAKAIQICEKGIAREPKNPRWYYLAARAENMRFNYAAAGKYASRARTNDGAYQAYLQQFINADAERLFQDISSPSAQEIIDRYRHLPNLPSEWWVMAYHKLFQTGYVVQALQAKQIGAQIYVDRHVFEGRQSTLTFIRALLLTGDYKRTQEVCAEFLERDANSRLRDHVLQLDSYCRTVISNDRMALTSVTGGTDTEFDRMIRGKSVAVVGPASTDEQWGEEIDAFDIVIRPGMTKPMPSSLQASLGKRTDIVYYNAPDEMNHLEDIIKLLENRAIRMGVMRTSDNLLNGSYSNLPVRLTTTIPKFWQCDFGLLGIPKIVWDTLKFSPKRLKVFNSDFYSNSSPYRKGYREDEEDEVRKRTLGRHDLLQNFIMCQNLFRSKAFEADPNLSSLLREPLGLYLGKLGSSFRSSTQQ